MRKDLAPLVEDACGDASVRRRGLVDPEIATAVRQRAAAEMPGSAYPQLWTLMILELWCRAVLDPCGSRDAERRAVGVS
jgi:hypothetical protein